MKFENMDDLITNWTDRVRYEATYLAESILSEIWHRMENTDVNKAELARRTGWSRSYVTRVFSRGQNLTLRSIASALAALDARLVVRVVSAESDLCGLAKYESVRSNQPLPPRVDNLAMPQVVGPSQPPGLPPGVTPSKYDQQVAA